MRTNDGWKRWLYPTRTVRPVARRGVANRHEVGEGPSPRLLDEYVVTGVECRARRRRERAVVRRDDHEVDPRYFQRLGHAARDARGTGCAADERLGTLRHRVDRGQQVEAGRAARQPASRR